MFSNAPSLLSCSRRPNYVTAAQATMTEEEKEGYYLLIRVLAFSFIDNTNDQIDSWQVPTSDVTSIQTCILY